MDNSRKMNQKITQYIEKQKSPQKEICQKLRDIIFKTLPNIEEKMQWGVPTYGKGKFYFVALKKQVNLGFSLKGLSSEEIKLLEGSGKTMKHIKINSISDIDEIRIVKLLQL
jgi:uncharacterized protein YdhG (YjbR/CyaY superfamily)